jgi:hypothetical protein
MRLGDEIEQLVARAEIRLSGAGALLNAYTRRGDEADWTEAHKQVQIAHESLSNVVVLLGGAVVVSPFDPTSLLTDLRSRAYMAHRHLTDRIVPVGSLRDEVDILARSVAYAGTLLAGSEVYALPRTALR